MLVNAKWDMLENGWNFTIMGSFWFVPSKMKWDWERPNWNFNTTNVYFVKLPVEYKAQYVAVVS